MASQPSVGAMPNNVAHSTTSSQQEGNTASSPAAAATATTTTSTTTMAATASTPPPPPPPPATSTPPTGNGTSDLHKRHPAPSPTASIGSQLTATSPDGASATAAAAGATTLGSDSPTTAVTPPASNPIITHADPALVAAIRDQVRAEYRKRYSASLGRRDHTIRSLQRRLDERARASRELGRIFEARKARLSTSSQASGDSNPGGAAAQSGSGSSAAAAAQGPPPRTRRHTAPESMLAIPEGLWDLPESAAVTTAAAAAAGDHSYKGRGSPTSPYMNGTSDHERDDLESVSSRVVGHSVGASANTRLMAALVGVGTGMPADGGSTNTSTTQQQRSPRSSRNSFEPLPLHMEEEEEGEVSPGAIPSGVDDDGDRLSPLPLFASVRRVRGGKSPPIASPSATSTAGVSEGSLPSAAWRHSEYAFPGPGTGTATGGATTPTPTSDASPASSNDAAARGRSASAHARTSLVATLQRMSSRDRPRRGCVWGWGALPNSYGSPPLVSAAPAFGVAPGYGVAQMAVGGEHVLFLLESGDVYTLDVRTPALTPTPEAGGGGSGGGGVTAAAAAAGGRVLTAADVTALKAAAEREPQWVQSFGLDKALRDTTITYIACDRGEVFTWGSGRDGRLGHGDTISLRVPRVVVKLLGREAVLGVSCGGAHTAAITASGTLYTWGRGRNGRLGLNDASDQTLPRTVKALRGRKMVAVACGRSFTVAIEQNKKTGGTVWCWGRAREGQCGPGAKNRKGHYADVLSPLRLKAGPEATQPPRDVVAISCGHSHTLALTREGAVHSWGYNEFRQLGYGNVTDAGPQQVPLGKMRPRVKPSNVKAVVAGAFHSFAVLRGYDGGGALVGWGRNKDSELGLGLGGQRARDTSPPSHVRTPIGLAGVRQIVGGHGFTYLVQGPPLVTVASARPAELSAGSSTTGASAGNTTPSADASAGTDGGGAGGGAGAGAGAGAVGAGAGSTTPGGSSNGAGGGVGGVGASSDSVDASAAATGSGADIGGSGERPSSGSAGGVERRKSLVPSRPATSAQAQEREKRTIAAIRRWEERILPNWESQRNLSATHTQWRLGIPASLRRRVWPLAIGNALKMNPTLYRMYRQRAQAALALPQSDAVGREWSIKRIHVDLPRTFPELNLFKVSAPLYQRLRTVLETYTCYRPDMGYIQGMSYLAAMLCLHIEDTYLVVQCLANLMVSEHLFDFYQDEASLEQYYHVFDQLLEDHNPKILKHLRKHDVDHTLYLFPWLQTLFLKVLPLDTAGRVFDCFLLDGTIFLLRAAVALLSLLAPTLLSCDMEGTMWLLTFSERYADEWKQASSEAALFRAIESVHVPPQVSIRLSKIVHNVYFYRRPSRGHLSRREEQAKKEAARKLRLVLDL